MEKTIELDTEKIYDIPQYDIVRRRNRILVIAANTANWIVLSNEQQLEIFSEISNKKRICDILDKYGEFMPDIIEVLTQIEAKEFTLTQVKSIFCNDTMHLYVTNSCNLACPHCYMYSGKGNNKELDLQEIKNLVKNFKKYNGKSVVISGGEATIRKDICDILNMISQEGLEITILSNGCLWNDDLINCVTNINVERVQISIDGYNEKTNAQIRGEGNFNKALRTIDLLIERNVPVSIGITPPYEFVKKEKQSYIKFAQQMLDKNKDKDFYIRFSYSFIEGRTISKNTIERYNNEYFKIIDSIMKEIYPQNEKEGFICNLSDYQIFDNCGYGGLNIASNGDVFFCSRVSEVKKYANIRVDSFEKIMEMSAKAKKIANINNLKPCSECELKYICGGGCRVEHFLPLTQIDDLDNPNIKEIPARVCSQENKEFYYDLMLQTNEELFR